jgi:predicted N-acetyltransferase YhbS
MTEPRAIQQGDIASLAQLLDDVFRRSRGITDQSQLTDFPLVFTPVNYANSRVIVEDGQIVSHAALWPRELIVEDRRLKAAVIVSVATQPDYRRRGHAAALMRDLHNTLQTEGFDLAILWTAVPEFYRKLGWEVVSPRGMIATVDARSATTMGGESCEVIAFEPTRHLDDVMAIHDQEDVRFERTRDEALRLLTLPKIQVWVAKLNARVVAYLVNADACNKRGLIEYGGQLEHVTSLVRHVLKSDPATADLDWMLFRSRPDLAEWAESIGLSCRPLESSKGSGFEMILPVRPVNIPQHVRENLFVWGLDWA